MHLHTMCKRELANLSTIEAETQVEQSGLYFGTYSGLTIAMNRARVCSIFFACSSTIFIVSHFFTPRIPMDLGPFGNTTL